MKKVIVVVKGGVVQDVFADPDVEIAVVDFDNAEDDDEYAVVYGPPDGRIEDADSDVTDLIEESK